MDLTETLQMQMLEQSPILRASPEIGSEALQTLKLQNSELQSVNQSLLLEMENVTGQVMELSAKLESATQTIQMLQSQNSGVRSENQNLLSQMTSASEQIELLTDRAASVNLIEQENLKLKEEAENSRSATADAEIAARDSTDRLESEKQMRIKSEQKYEAERRERLIAQELAHKVEYQIKGIQGKYRSVFIGIVIFTVTIAVLVAYDHKSVLAECGQWFTDRWESIISIGVSLRGTYLSLFSITRSSLPGLTAERHKMISTAVGIFLIFVIVALSYLLYTRTWKIRFLISRRIIKAANNELKMILIITISICLFYCCLFLREPIKSITTMNILSVWLILSIASTILLLLPDIIGR